MESVLVQLGDTHRNINEHGSKMVQCQVVVQMYVCTEKVSFRNQLFLSSKRISTNTSKIAPQHSGEGFSKLPMSQGVHEGIPAAVQIAHVVADGVDDRRNARALAKPIHCCHDVVRRPKNHPRVTPFAASFPSIKKSHITTH